MCTWGLYIWYLGEIQLPQPYTYYYSSEQNEPIKQIDVLSH